MKLLIYPAVSDERLAKVRAAAGAMRVVQAQDEADAVAQVAGRAELEVSGGVDDETVLVYATIPGVNFVSMGALTHSAPALDLSLILETLP